MLQKYWKPLLATSLVSVVMVGCSNEKQIAPDKEQEVTKKGDFKLDAYYKLNDKDTLVEVNGKKLTVAEVKKNTFDQMFLTEINQFIEKQLILKKYPVSDAEVDKTLKKYGKVDGVELDREQIRQQMAYDKAVHDGIKVTDKDLKEIYDANYKNSGKTFEEMKPQLKEMAPYYFGNKVSEKLASIRTSEGVSFKDKELEKQINDLFVKPKTNKNNTQNEPGKILEKQ
ncbi:MULTISPECIES: hypothetical protein [Bacillus cereus group]|uniref:hypothetical protein n=1 Tax=Bacillus cereus group TaxID=86661 RepID=UPI0022E78C80|nr:hypothetical protein [Bacillus cereus group sp. TH152-1LC]MDA1674489.1 hypothetical protein [Bacillus cereus group sp. TH152-1LC]